MIKQISSVAQLASRLEMQAGRLYSLIRRKDRFVDHFLVHDLDRPHKLPRPVVAAKGPLLAAQKIVLNEILGHSLCISECSYSKKGRSIRDNALRHKGNRFFLTADIQQCFPSINTNAILKLLLSCEIKYDLASIISEICSYEDELKQGFVTSPILADAILSKIDVRLLGMASSMGVIYSRYVDDLTFSASFELSSHSCGLLRLLKEILYESGFGLKDEKTCDSIAAEKTGEDVLVTTLRCNDDGIDVSKEFIIRFESRIRSLTAYGNGADLAGQYYSKGQILGTFYYICWIHPGRRPALSGLIKRINWEVVEKRAKLESRKEYRKTKIERLNPSILD